MKMIDRPIHPTIGGLCVGLMSLALLLGATEAHAQQGRKGSSPLVAASDELLAPGGSTGMMTLAAGQPDLPITISPLRIEEEPNGVNIDSGKTQMTPQVLSVPGAPHLRFDRVQNSAPYISGRLSGLTWVRKFGKLLGPHDRRRDGVVLVRGL